MAGVGQSVICPRDPTWLRRMLEVLPPGLRGKLAVYESCPSVQGNSGQGGGWRDRRRNRIGQDVIRPRLMKN